MVAAILWPTWPLLPMPVMITRPLMFASVSMQALNGPSKDASKACRPAISSSNVRRALVIWALFAVGLGEAMVGLDGVSGMFWVFTLDGIDVGELIPCFPR